MERDGRPLAATLAGVEVEAVLGRMRPINGWFSDAEARLLLSVACCALTELDDLHQLVEIGSYEGRSTVVLASAVEALRPGGRLVAVDPHEGLISLAGRPDRLGSPTYDALCCNLATTGLRSWVDIRRVRSTAVVWDRPVGLLFIDGLHDYQSVRGDFDHFARWVPPGGYVAFHDYAANFPGVVACVDEIRRQGTFTDHAAQGDLIVLQRPVPERAYEH